MAYFLKKTNYTRGLYLQIYDSFFDKTAKRNRHKCFKKLGYVEDLINSGISDPVEHFQKEVIKLNKERKAKDEQDKIKLISSRSPVRNFGYFLTKILVNALGLRDAMEPMKYLNNFSFPISSLIEALVYSRIVQPCSKLKTYNEVLPLLYEDYDFSLDQIYDGLDFIGKRYSQFVEIMNHCISNSFKRNTSVSYFDCTNYYFEIDLENQDKQKGPSKENRPNPIIGQALLLDGNSIPMGMKMYPGNESEKPKIREIINDLKRTNNISGKTIQVADKGLNCGDNIYNAIQNGDGYIFSQSVLKLDEVEKQWVISDNDYSSVKDSDGNVLYKIKSFVDKYPIRITNKAGKKETIYVQQKRVATFNPALKEKKTIEIMKLVDKASNLCHCQIKKSEFGDAAKYVNFIDDDGNIAKAVINSEKVQNDLKYAGYNLIVSSEINMSKQEIYRVYHKLWKIEDTFRILKSQLDARPVYLQSKDRIYGHFLICYYAVTLLRLLEEKVFKNTLSVYEIKDIIRNLNLIKQDNGNINISTDSNNINKICEMHGLNIKHYYLQDKELDKLFKMKYRLK